MIEAAAPDFTRLVDLACERNNGIVVEANDDFFAAKENLVRDSAPVFKPDEFTERGKWMDGWETRRRRTPGHDWCIVKLGLRGSIRGVDIDTSHFIGNHPPYASIEAADATVDGETLHWREILPQSDLQAGTHNYLPIHDESCATHLRLNIFPDGGVARLRVYGDVEPDWTSVIRETIVELSALANGGQAVACSDEHFGRMSHLLLADRPRNMGDGWETARRRGRGNDWVVVRLGVPGMLSRIEVDTTHFKGNYPDRCSVDGCIATSEGTATSDIEHASWMELLPMQKLSSNYQHVFENLVHRGPVTHVRLNIFPDGGVGRFRVFGNRAD